MRVDGRGDVLIGTSGFAYPHWRHGVFYPDGLPASRELEFYATRFRTVELNSTFYRLPERTQFVHWKERTPGHFVFAVKASRFITHVKRLKDSREAVAAFLDRARGLGRKLGPTLFQLPPNFSVNLERLHAFLRLLPARPLPVLEFRHPSWFTEEVYALLRARKANLCIPVGGPLPDPPVVVTGPAAYLRLHSGRGRDGGFTHAQLADWAERIRGLIGVVPSVYVYFNNDWAGFAVRNAATLRSLLGAEG
jgi:uncharacterized protein YecE (DUF72 family)